MNRDASTAGNVEDDLTRNSNGSSSLEDDVGSNDVDDKASRSRASNGGVRSNLIELRGWDGDEVDFGGSAASEVGVTIRVGSNDVVTLSSQRE